LAKKRYSIYSRGRGEPLVDVLLEDVAVYRAIQKSATRPRDMGERAELTADFVVLDTLNRFRNILHRDDLLPDTDTLLGGEAVHLLGFDLGADVRDAELGAVGGERLGLERSELVVRHSDL
jgi:hypothetical protein